MKEEGRHQLISRIDLVKLLPGTRYFGQAQISYITTQVMKSALDYSVYALPSVMVAIPAIPKSSHAPDPAYDVENFVYNQADNTYTCPQGHLLTTNGTWHKSTGGSLFQQFKTTKCKTCNVRALCTKSEKNGKIVQRRKHAINIEQNKKRIEENKAIYKKRQAITEHPFGTIKRQWGFHCASSFFELLNHHWI